MRNKEEIKAALENKLGQVTSRLNMLDLIEERLLLMKQLAQRVITEDLTDNEIVIINKQVNALKEEPFYKATHDLNHFTKLEAKIFVIDDGGHVTMMLAEEY